METNYGYLTLLPVVAAIGLALWKRQVILSLLFGIVVGVTIINHWNPVLGVLHGVSTYIVGKGLADKDNAGVVMFALLVGGMLGIVQGAGGIEAVANYIRRKALSVRSTQLAAAMMGVAMFFDDYASCITVGSAMKGAAAKQRISSEKLSYILDTTAAPVSSLAPLSTWIAMQLGLITAGLQSIQSKTSPVVMYGLSLPCQFYSIMALVFLFVIILSRRDFGPMYRAELRARTTGAFVDESSTPLVSDQTSQSVIPSRISVYSFLVPVLSFLLATIGGLWVTGYEPGRSFAQSLSNASPVTALTWSIVISSLVAAAFALLNARIGLNNCVSVWFEGMRGMLMAAAVLTLTFALKAVLKDMKLATWLATVGTQYLSGVWLPCITFVLAGLVSFATGTSWGTSALMVPIAIPVVAAVSSGNEALIALTIGAVFSGSVFGDHCSPISDTTVLSSMTGGADHVDHVRTQMPYAMTAALIALLFGFFPASFGVPSWLCLIVCIVAAIIAVRLFGKKVPDFAHQDSQVLREKVPSPVIATNLS